MDKPEKLNDIHLEFLDNLRNSGITNMYGAGRYITAYFSELTEKEAS